MAHRGILATALALLVAGVVLVALAGGVALAAIGWGLVGVGGVVLVSLAFLLVGESEDRDRLRNPRG
jgi:hypothetical protein